MNSNVFIMFQAKKKFIVWLLQDMEKTKTSRNEIVEDIGKVYM